MEREKPMAFNSQGLAAVANRRRAVAFEMPGCTYGQHLAHSQLQEPNEVKETKGEDVSAIRTGQRPWHGGDSCSIQGDPMTRRKRHLPT